MSTEKEELAAALDRIVAEALAMKAQQTADYDRGMRDGAAQERARIVKTGPGKPMRGCNHPEFYANGLADGAAQERARIVSWLRAGVLPSAWGFADDIERGEAAIEARLEAQKGGE